LGSSYFEAVLAAAAAPPPPPPPPATPTATPTATVTTVAVVVAFAREKTYTHWGVLLLSNDVSFKETWPILLPVSGISFPLTHTPATTLKNGGVSSPSSSQEKDLGKLCSRIGNLGASHWTRDSHPDLIKDEIVLRYEGGGSSLLFTLFPGHGGEGAG